MKPSEKIKEIAESGVGEFYYLGLNNKGKYYLGRDMCAIIQYLDEEYESRACERGEHDDEPWNDVYTCKRCHIVHS